MIPIVLVILGLAFGSFVHAFVWRLHEKDVRKKLSKQQKQALSIISGRSMCGHCKHELAWYDLLPVVSWFSLGGKCRYCGHKIEDNPLVELCMPFLFLLSYAAWPYEWDGTGIILFGFWLLFLVGFMVLVVYDLKWMELPNRVVYPLVGLAVLQVGVMSLTGDVFSTLTNALWGFLFIGGLFYALFQISGGKWIGGGDVKLSFMIGLLVGGPTGSLMVIFFASLIGTVVSLPLMVARLVKPSSRIPFGPFLLLATIMVYLYGTSISDWYLRYFL